MDGHGDTAVFDVVFDAPSLYSALLLIGYFILSMPFLVRAKGLYERIML